MKNLISLLLFLLAGQALFAADADPRAKALLDEVKKKYESYKSLSIDFQLIIEVPGEERQIQSGKMIQQGEQYFVQLPDRNIYCDGKALWLYLKEEGEVQINDVDEEEEGILSPRDFLEIYQSDEYEYALTNEFTEKGRKLAQIEFKPKDADSDIAKLRLTIDRQSKEILQLRTFYKDGTRVGLVLSSLSANEIYPVETFRWKKAYCPDCYVEDLRM